MTPTIRRRIHRTLVVCALLILVGLAAAFALRSSMATHVARSRLERIARSHQLQAGFGSLSVEGLSTLHIQQLWVTDNPPTDTLLSLKTLKVKLHFLPLLRQNLEVEAIVADSLNLLLKSLQHTPSTAEEREKAVARAEEGSKEGTDYVREAHRFFRLLFDLLPADATLSRIHLNHASDSLSLQVALPRLELRQHHFHTTLQVTENGDMQEWQLRGLLHPAARQLQLALIPTASPLPYVGRRFGAMVGFDSLSIGMEVTADETSERLTLQGNTSLVGLRMAHQRLSSSTVAIDSTSAQFTLHIHPTAMELDSCSSFRLNHLELHPYLRVERLPAWHLLLYLHKPWFPSQQLFASLPRGLFSNLQGIATHGELAYDLHFDLDLSQPDSLQLYSALHRRGFGIDHYGATPLDRMSEEFLYTAYEEGEPVRTFAIGPSWEHFIPLSQIPPLLQTAVLQSEDGGFFYHQGFLPDALRDALAYDIKLRRFARGGSTISMQLVKNVFLSREKNLARKLEEALIVWLIEQQRLTSKERMLEVYFNIAEWGPLVYGLREATQYYFEKTPQQLTPEECIFLATIIPRPKHWWWSFTPEGTLRDNQEPHFRLLAERLVANGLLTPEQSEQISIHHLQLKGEAARRFKP